MSGAGIAVPHGAVIIRDMGILAPKFRKGVDAAIDECADLELDAMVWESYRTNELQGLYYKRGRSVKPPDRPVTNARTNLYSWHGYGLAVDVVSREHLWFNPAAKPELRLPARTDPLYREISERRKAYAALGQRWFDDVAAVFKRHDCKWGGDWVQRDTPHFQWWRCRPTPSDLARQLLADGGLERVWQEVLAA